MPSARNLEPDYGKSPLNVTVTQADFRWATLLMRHPRGVLRVLRIGLRWMWAMLTRKDLAVRGQAFAAGAARRVCSDAGVPRAARHRARRPAHRGRPRRAVSSSSTTHQQRTIRARHGVVLACGGFEHNEAMRKQYQREPIGSVVDGRCRGEHRRRHPRRANALGAALELMDDAWWGPSIPLTGGPWFCLAERTLPGGIMVNARGERFMNEALPYVEAVHRMYGGDEYGRGDGPGENIPCWMVIDQRYRNRYVFAGVPPRRPFPGRWYKAGRRSSAQRRSANSPRRSVSTRPTLERTIATVQRLRRRPARTSTSAAATAATTATTATRPSSRIRACRRSTKAPFYAVTMVPGDLGTKGGVRTDVRARVLRADGSVIDGLYAAGNVSAPVMGHTYAGPGATIGPAITFGYLAALDIAERARAGSKEHDSAH